MLSVHHPRSAATGYHFGRSANQYTRVARMSDSQRPFPEALRPGLPLPYHLLVSISHRQVQCTPLSMSMYLVAQAHMTFQPSKIDGRWAHGG